MRASQFCLCSKVRPSKSHGTISHTQISSVVFVPSSDAVDVTLGTAPSPSVFRTCRSPLEENSHNDSHGQHDLTSPGEAAPCGRPLCKHCGFRGQSLPRAEYETTVAALGVAVESVGAVGVAADEPADASVSVKAMIGDVDVTSTAGAASTKTFCCTKESVHNI